MALPHPRHPSGLEATLADARRDSAEFPDFLANHAPMMLVALDGLGASESRVAEFLARYRVANGLVPTPPPVAPLDAGDWRSVLGRREREGDARAYFEAAIARRGLAPVLAEALPTLAPGVGASALHALMRLAYAVMRRDGAEAGTALGYWAVTFLPMPPATGAAPVTDDPAAVLARTAALPSLRHTKPETDLLWHSIRAVGDEPGFAPAVDWLAIGPDTPARLAATALRLFAGTMDFAALHALTGLHWVRLLLPFCPDPALLMRHFWQVIAALVPKLGFPDMPDEVTVARWRHLPCPDWATIAAAAVASDDEHDISLAFSARAEEAVWGDRLYRVVAARRLGLVA